MNENTGNSGNDFFFDLLDNPAHLSHSNAFNLQLLINDFPQSGLLRSMLAAKQEAESLQSASVYVDPKLLYKAAKAPHSLRAVTEDQIAIIQKPEGAKPFLFTTDHAELPHIPDESNYFHVPIGADVAYIEDYEDLTVTDDANDAGNEQQFPAQFIDAKATAEDSVGSDEDKESITVEPEQVTSEYKQPETEQTNPEAGEETEQQSTFDAPYLSDNNTDVESEISHGYDEYLSRTDETVETETEEKNWGERPTEPHQEIEDEVYEEIVSIEDIGLEQLALMGKTTVKSNDDQPEHASQGEPEVVSAEDSYFVFEPAPPEEVNNTAPARITAQYVGGETAGSSRVSRYNDEKMPYSFMWWLDKTRKEHAAIYQPFVVDGKFHSATTAAPSEKPQLPADSLQQQYIENIFTVTAVVSDLNVTPPKVEALPVETKEDKIIERFIHEEPQIKHPAKAKLDNENKAKKSSEDRDELVTETLAKIYTEQMLYHKAILTYKKLMLKFPEKSLYFAGQIETLEKKIN